MLDFLDSIIDWLAKREKAVRGIILVLLGAYVMLETVQIYVQITPEIASDHTFVPTHDVFGIILGISGASILNTAYSLFAVSGAILLFGGYLLFLFWQEAARRAAYERAIHEAKRMSPDVFLGEQK